MSDKQTFLKDKPYGFIPLMENCDRGLGKPHNRFDRDTFSGKLKIQLNAKTMLHIGDGQVEVLADDGGLLHKMMRRNGQVVIPGSSVKGMVRSIAEAVSHSCAVKLPDPKLQEMKCALPSSNKEQCQTTDRICPACSIFGMAFDKAGYRGKVVFGEFTGELAPKILEYEISAQEAPFKNYPKTHDMFRLGSNFGNERLYYCMACDQRKTGGCDSCDKSNYFSNRDTAGENRPMRLRGRKFYKLGAGGYPLEGDNNGGKRSLFEMVDKGSSFVGEIVFQGLTKRELSLLFFSLGLDGSFSPALGYAKSSGFGLIQTVLGGVEDLMSRYQGHGILTDEYVKQLAKEYGQISDPSDVKSAIRELRSLRGDSEYGTL